MNNQERPDGNEGNEGGFRPPGKGMILLAVLLTLMVTLSLCQMQEGKRYPWTECRESLVEQMVSGNCTPRSGLGGQQSGQSNHDDPGSRPAMPAGEPPSLPSERPAIGTQQP